MKSTTKFKNHDDSPFIACICLHWKVDVNLHCFHFESSWQNVSRNLRVNFFAKFPDLVCVSSKMKYSRHDWSWDFDVFFSLSVLTKLTETLKTSQMEDRNRNQRQSLFPLPSSTCLPFSFLVLWSKINRRKGQSWQRKHSNLLFVSIDGFQGTRLPFASIFACIPRDVDMMCILSFKSTKSSYMCVHPFKQRSIAITCTIIRLDTQRNRLCVEFFNRFVTRFDSSTTTQECNNLQQKNDKIVGISHAQDHCFSCCCIRLGKEDVHSLQMEIQARMTYLKETKKLGDSFQSICFLEQLQ